MAQPSPNSPEFTLSLSKGRRWETGKVGRRRRKYTIPQSMTVEYILGDHLGSTSLTTDSTGTKTSEMRYNPWGEVRYTWTTSLSTTPAYQLTRYTYTGQYSYMDDPTTTTATEGFGLMFYQARWYDPGLGRFAQADTIIPLESQGVQAWDRYAYVNNNSVNYTDPTGHLSRKQIQSMFKVETWDKVTAMFEKGGELEGQWGFLELLRKVEEGDTIYGVHGRSRPAKISFTEIGHVIEFRNDALIIKPGGGAASLLSLAKEKYNAYAFERKGEMTILGNGHVYTHVEVDEDVNLVTLGADVAGIIGSVVGLGWVSKSDDVIKMGNVVSRASSVYGGLNSAFGSDEPDWLGIAISGASFAGPLGLPFSIIGFARDLLYIGR